MNDYCLNQSQGLNARQHTSIYNTSTPTPLPFHLPLDVFLINQKNMKHEHKLWFSFVPRYYLIFLFWQNHYGIFS